MVDNDAAVAQRVRMNGYAGSAHLLGSRDGLLEVIDVLFLVGRVDEGVIRVAVEARNCDTGLLSGLAGRVEVAHAPVPELYGFKAVVLGCLEALEPGQLGIQGVDAGAFSQCHLIQPPRS